jgi:rubrerythrin
MTNTPNTAATKAGDLLSKAINLIDEAEYEGMPRDWLKRASELYEQARIITTQPSEPASAAEGAKTCAVCDGRGYIASYLIEGDRDERCPTCSAPDPAQSADK